MARRRAFAGAKLPVCNDPILQRRRWVPGAFLHVRIAFGRNVKRICGLAQGALPG
jgi:hypothetical protein